MQDPRPPASEPAPLPEASDDGREREGGPTGHAAHDRGSPVPEAPAEGGEGMSVAWPDDLRLSAGEVVLRRWRPDDAPAVVRACEDGDIARWIPVIPHPYGLADALEFLAETDEEWRAGSSRAFAIVDVDDRLLGAVTLHGPEGHLAEIGYWLDPAARGRGVATRAVRLLTRYAFRADRSLVRIGLRTLSGNDASGAVARRSGFTLEGVLRSLEPVRGELVDVVVYSLLRSESGVS